MNIYLPVAEISINVFHLILLGVASGLASGLYGIGGGIITTPMLIFYGIPSFVAVGTSTMQLFGTSISGTIRNAVEKNVDFLLGTIMAVGTYFGSLQGLTIMHWATRHKHEDILVSSIFVIVMASVLLPIYKEMLFNIFSHYSRNSESFENYPSETKRGFFYFHSNASNTSFNIITVISTGFIVGVCSSTIGIGGGVILVPVMSYFLKVPLKIATATSLYQIIPASLSTLFIQTQKGNVDIMLGIVLMSISSIFVHVGAFLAKKIHQQVIKASLAIILTTMLAMFLNKIFGMPKNIFVMY